MITSVCLCLVITLPVSFDIFSVRKGYVREVAEGEPAYGDETVQLHTHTQPQHISNLLMRSRPSHCNPYTDKRTTAQCRQRRRCPVVQVRQPPLRGVGLRGRGLRDGGHALLRGQREEQPGPMRPSAFDRIRHGVCVCWLVDSDSISRALLSPDRRQAA